MTIHFAAARTTAHSPVARALARKAVRRASNDNPGGKCETDTRILGAALRHFAEHGLRAAEEAAARAEQAMRSGDRATCLFWTDVCYKLDRALARDLKARATLQD